MSWLAATGADGAAHERWLEAESARLVDWALGSAHRDGGFGWRSATGDLVPSEGRPLWVNCRMIHCVALGHLLGDPRCGDALSAAVTQVPALFRDDDHGGWF